MAQMLDIFSSNPAFSVGELTLSLQRIPFVPFQIGRLGLFREERLTTITAYIEIQGTRLALVPELPRGAPATPNVEDRRHMVAFRVPHFPMRDQLLADAVQNIRAFGSVDALQGPEIVVNQRNAGMMLKLDVTLEHLRLGAVKGIIITAVNRLTGQSEQEVNLFEHFHVEPQPVREWPIVGAGRLAQEGPAWASQLTDLSNSLSRAMADELSGGVLTGVHCICGSEFYDAVFSHPERRAAFIALTSAPIIDPNLDIRFSFRGITYEEYRGRVGPVRFVEPDIGYFFPVGVPDLFLEIYAPADYMEAVNTVALPRYAKMEAMDFDKGVHLETQMNVLPLCTAPRTLFTARVTPYQPPEATAATASAAGQARRSGQPAR